jgi:fatty acid desaturase
MPFVYSLDLHTALQLGAGSALCKNFPMPVAELAPPAAAALPATESSPYLAYRHALLLPTQIKMLSALRPWRPLVSITACWSCILASFAAVAVHPVWWVILFAIPVIGNRLYALSIIGHDAMHRRLLDSVAKNDFWADLLIFAPIGAITRINNRNHLLHHRHLASLDDPDRRKHACFNKAERLPLFGYLSGITSFWSSAKAVFLSSARANQSAENTSLSSFRYSLRDFALLLGWFLVLAGGLSWLIGWWAYPLLWLLPVYSFMFLGDNFRSFAEHSHPENDQMADWHRLITFTSNPVERMLIAPMNMNYHAVHHLWPSIPYYNLPLADQIIRQHPASAGLEWRKSYFTYLLHYWSLLPLTECKPGR